MNKIITYAVVLSLTLAFSGCISSSNAAMNTKSAKPTSVPSVSKQPHVVSTMQSPRKIRNRSASAKITEKEFKQIYKGMTYKKVVQIVGGEGKLSSEIGKKGTNLYTAMYSWKGKGRREANVSLTFQGGKLINKSQFRLVVGPESSATISMMEFKEMKKGLSYKRVQEIVGGKGSIEGVTGERGTQYFTQIIFYKGKTEGSDALLTFQGGKLLDKTELGLK